VREWKGAEHVVTVREHDFEFPRLGVQVIVGDCERGRRNEMERVGVLRPPADRGGQMNTPPRKVRCGIYCRKSSDEGLSQTFNSLDAQRESCLN
jgi:hypothetical protein